MPRVPARALLCGVVAAALAGCASSKTPEPTPEPAPARTSLADVKSAQDGQAQEITRLAGDIKALDAQQAFLVAEVKSLGEQVAKLKASVDEAESTMRALRATPVPPESRPAAAPAPPPQAAPAAAEPAPKPAAPAPAASPSASAAPASRNGDADRAFAGALAKFRAGDDGQAALEFTDFAAQFPSHPQAAAAQNYIGEAYFHQHEYKQAMAEYQKTVDGYTQAAQVSEALLKIGLCQRALGDAAAAKAAWEQVVKQFPKSDAARQARALLANRPAGGR